MEENREKEIAGKYQLLAAQMGEVEYQIKKMMKRSKELEEQIDEVQKEFAIVSKKKEVKSAEATK